MATREPTLTELLTVLARQTGTLVRQEVRLATVELTDTARAASWPLVQLALSGLLGVMAAATLLVAAMLGLGLLLPLWASALCLGLALLGGSLRLLRHGRAQLLAIDAVPTQTLLSIEETSTWATNQLH